MVLLTQSLPYLAAVTVSVVAAFPAQKALLAVSRAPTMPNLVPGFSLPALQSENGD
jgi:hypothetical protein